MIRDLQAREVLEDQQVHVETGEKEAQKELREQKEYVVPEVERVKKVSVEKEAKKDKLVFPAILEI